MGKKYVKNETTTFRGGSSQWPWRLELFQMLSESFHRSFLVRPIALPKGGMFVMLSERFEGTGAQGTKRPEASREVQCNETIPGRY